MEHCPACGTILSEPWTFPIQGRSVPCRNCASPIPKPADWKQWGELTRLPPGIRVTQRVKQVWIVADPDPKLVALLWVGLGLYVFGAGMFVLLVDGGRDPVLRNILAAAGLVCLWPCARTTWAFVELWISGDIITLATGLQPFRSTRTFQSSAVQRVLLRTEGRAQVQRIVVATPDGEVRFGEELSREQRVFLARVLLATAFQAD